MPFGAGFGRRFGFVVFVGFLRESVWLLRAESECGGCFGCGSWGVGGGGDWEPERAAAGGGGDWRSAGSRGGFGDRERSRSSGVWESGPLLWTSAGGVSAVLSARTGDCAAALCFDGVWLGWWGMEQWVGWGIWRGLGRGRILCAAALLVSEVG